MLAAAVVVTGNITGDPSVLGTGSSLALGANDCPQQGHHLQGLALPLLYSFKICLLEMRFTES